MVLPRGVPGAAFTRALAATLLATALAPIPGLAQDHDPSLDGVEIAPSPAARSPATTDASLVWTATATLDVPGDLRRPANPDPARERRLAAWRLEARAILGPR